MYIKILSLFILSTFCRKANQSDLKGAIEDFRKALEVNPNHRNGKKYLIETSLSLARR